MKKFEKILLVTVFLCTLPVANLFALSQEAHNAIEAMRAKLLADEKAQEAAVEPEYVPGKELAAALERFRAKIYASNPIAPVTENEAETESEASADDVATAEAEVVSKADADVQVIDQTEDEALTDDENNQAEEMIYSYDNEAVKAEMRKQNKEAIEAMRARVMERNKEASPEEPVATEAEERPEVAIVEEAEPAVAEAEEASKDYVPGQLLQESVAKFREQNRNREAVVEENTESVVETEEKVVPALPSQEVLAEKSGDDSYQTMEKANQEIEEIFNNPEKRAEVAEKGRKQVEARKVVQKKQVKKAEKPKDKPKVEDDSNDSKQIDDERFNDYISRYNFKMPENYRIIVE